MRRILFLLLVIAMIFACSKNEKIDDELPEQGEKMSIYEQAKSLVKDSIGLTIMSHTDNISGDVYKDKFIFTGVKQGKFWFGIFSALNNQDSKNIVGEEIISYTTKFDYSLHRDINIGYGEKESLDIGYILMSIWGCVESKEFEMVIIGKKDNLVSDNPRTIGDFVIVRDGIEKHYENTLYTSKNCWYNNTMIFDDYQEVIYYPDKDINIKLYSKDGGVLYSLPEYINLNAYDTIIPLNINEGIFRKRECFTRENIRDGNTIWRTYIPNIQSNSKTSITKNDEINNEWFYTMDITKYDGSKEIRNFAINIETGKYREVREKEPVTDVSIIELEKNTNFIIGEELLLTYNVLPEYAYNKNVQIHSSDESIISVDENMKLHAKSKGECIITIDSEDGNATKSYNVEVGSSSSIVTFSVDESGIIVGGFFTGYINCTLSNNSDNLVHINSIEIVDGHGETFFIGEENILLDVPPHSISEKVSLYIKEKYLPRLILKYQYNGEEHKFEYNIGKQLKK